MSTVIAAEVALSVVLAIASGLLANSLRRLADGDWVGDEAPASFTPYKRGRRRH